MFGDNKENLGELQLCLSKGYDNYDWAQRILFELDNNSLKRGKHYIQMSLNNIKIDMDSKNIYIQHDSNIDQYNQYFRIQKCVENALKLFEVQDPASL